MVEAQRVSCMEVVRIEIHDELFANLSFEIGDRQAA